MDYAAQEQAEKRGAVQSQEAVLNKMSSWFQTVAWFTSGMLQKMLRNTHKIGWQDMSVGYLRYRIGVELKELDEALLNFESELSREKVDSILSETYDCANFCLMLADRVKTLFDEQKSSHENKKC